MVDDDLSIKLKRLKSCRLLYCCKVYNAVHNTLGSNLSKN